MLHERVIKLSKARVHVHSDSVLCLRKMHPHLVVMERGLEYFLGNKVYNEQCGIDGEPFEFEWNIFQDTPQWNCSARFR